MSNLAPSTVTKLHNEWASRPDDERYLSLIDMQSAQRALKARSVQRVISTRDLEFAPVSETSRDGLLVNSSRGQADLTHWSFGQAAALAGAPGGYLRQLPAPMAADCLNYGLRHTRPSEEIQIYAQRDESNSAVTLAAATGPRYGRVFNADVIDSLVDRFGDGATGDFRVPGIFGRQLDSVTKENTTLFASDRDMFVFLADEERRITLPNRRNGSGTLARGFYISNSEVGAGTLTLGLLLFDYVCSNRIIWGVEGHKTIKIRHSSGAPDRFMRELRPAMISYANSATAGIDEALSAAQNDRLGDAAAVDEFLAKRFGKAAVLPIKAAHLLEEQRPIETRWDAVTGATAWAKGKTYQNERVEIEKAAGSLLTF